MDEEERVARQFALDMAVRSALDGDTAETISLTAQTFYKFLKGDNNGN